jgi:alpha-L-fucosidase
VHLFAASESDHISTHLTASYSDGTNSTAAVLVGAWWSWPYPLGGDVVMPWFWSNQSADFNRSMVYLSSCALDVSKELTELKLPSLDQTVGHRLHVFAMSLVAASSGDANETTLEVQYVRSTQKWMERQGDVDSKTQIFEAVVNNVGDGWVLAEQDVKVIIESDEVETVVPGE